MSKCYKSGEVKEFSGRLHGTGKAAASNNGDTLVKQSADEQTPKVRSHDGHPLQKGMGRRS